MTTATATNSCEHCHRQAHGDGLVRVRLLALDGNGTTLGLRLCRRCATHPDSSWRRRWRVTT